MKFKKVLAILLALGVLTAFAACKSNEEAADQGSGADATVETPVPGGEEDAAGETDPAETEPEQTQPAVPEAEEPVVPETDGPAGLSVTLYTGNANADGLDETEYALDELTPDALIAALVDAGAIPEQTKCVSFEQSGDGKSLTLDLSGPFADGVRSMGTAGESMILGSLVNTFLDAYGADALTLTVDGAPLETGHNVYDLPLERFTFASADGAA